VSDRLRVAVVGCGIGRRHVEAFRSLPDQFDVVAVCDANEERAREAAHLYGVGRVSPGLDELCQAGDVDVIDLCTPPGLHFAQGVQVLAAGKHCICEKPLVGSLREVDDLLAAEARSGKRFMPIFQYRYGRGLQKLKLLKNSGLTGRAYITSIEMMWRRGPAYYATPWRGRWESDLGGMVNGLVVHALDMLMYVLGPVHSVFARTATMVNPIEVEDTSSTSMEMADGSFVSVTATLGSVVQITRHRFCFANLVAESNTRSYANSSEPWSFDADTPELQQQVDQALSGFEPRLEGFAGQFTRYHEAMMGGGDLPVTLLDSRRAIELVTAIYRSASTNSPVDLPLARDEWYNGWRPRESLQGGAA
jgi:predicted dehydrogenase